MPLLVYCLLSLTAILYEEAFPLFCVAPVDAGGLGWDAASIGALLSAGGFFLAATQFLLYPWLARRVASTKIFTRCAAALVVVVGATPLLPQLPPPLLVPSLLVLLALKQSLSSS